MKRGFKIVCFLMFLAIVSCEKAVIVPNSSNSDKSDNSMEKKFRDFNPTTGNEITDPNDRGNKIISIDNPDGDKTGRGDENGEIIDPTDNGNSNGKKTKV